MHVPILVIQGHPDCGRPHLCHALARAYADGARAAGHTVATLEPARLHLPLLTSPDEWQHAAPAPEVVAAQDMIRQARHLVFFYPLWLGDMPAMLKGFLEQVARPGFAIDPAAKNPLRAGLLRGRSARLVVTMGMPAPFYRWFYGAPGVRLMRRNILAFSGVAPVHTTLVGGAATLTPAQVDSWCTEMRQLGANGS